MFCRKLHMHHASLFAIVIFVVLSAGTLQAMQRPLPSVPTWKSAFQRLEREYKNHNDAAKKELSSQTSPSWMTLLKDLELKLQLLRLKGGAAQDYAQDIIKILSGQEIVLRQERFPKMDNFATPKMDNLATIDNLQGGYATPNDFFSKNVRKIAFPIRDTGPSDTEFTIILKSIYLAAFELSRSIMAQHVTAKPTQPETTSDSEETQTLDTLKDELEKWQTYRAEEAAWEQKQEHHRQSLKTRCSSHIDRILSTEKDPTRQEHQLLITFLYFVAQGDVFLKITQKTDYTRTEFLEWIHRILNIKLPEKAAPIINKLKYWINTSLPTNQWIDGSLKEDKERAIISTQYSQWQNNILDIHNAKYKRKT